MKNSPIDIAQAAGHIPSGLFITCAHDCETKQSDGFLASWVQQVSFNPLLISICIKPGRLTYDQIMDKKVFSLNVVGEHEKSCMKPFWSGYDADKNPFKDIDHEISIEGGIIIKRAKSTMICRMVETLKPGDHQIVIAEILSSYVQDKDAKTLVHHRRSGLEY